MLQKREDHAIPDEDLDLYSTKWKRNKDGIPYAIMTMAPLAHLPDKAMKDLFHMVDSYRESLNLPKEKRGCSFASVRREFYSNLNDLIHSLQVGRLVGLTPAETIEAIQKGAAEVMNDTYSRNSLFRNMFAILQIYDVRFDNFITHMWKEDGQTVFMPELIGTEGAEEDRVTAYEWEVIQHAVRKGMNHKTASKKSGACTKQMKRWMQANVEGNNSVSFGMMAFTLVACLFLKKESRPGSLTWYLRWVLEKFGIDAHAKAEAAFEEKREQKAAEAKRMAHRKKRKAAREDNSAEKDNERPFAPKKGNAETSYRQACQSSY
jgi:hypothetical protein